MKQTPMYINGEWITLEQEIQVNNPATNEIIATVPRAGAVEAKLAVDAAYEAFKDWSQRTAADRAALLMKWFHLLEENSEEIARIMTMEQGKPLKESRGEMTYANSFISWYAEEGKRIYGEIIPASVTTKRLFVHKQPIGVVANITPWNFPAAMITRKVGPALAAGCTTVIKPASQTPLTAFKMVELAEKAGIPKGVINIITGDSKAIGNTWMADSRVRKVSFTGSTEIGKLLMRQAADTVKKVALELGGHAPCIVTKNANIDKAVAGAIASKFRNAGQTCVCTNRIYVHESIAEEFSKKFAEATEKLCVGNGLEDGTDVGPMIDEIAVGKVQEQIEDAKAKGATVLVEGSANGSFMTPTVISNVTDEMLCMTEETFGPLAPIATFKTKEEAVERANNTPFGLAAYVFSENISEAIYIAENLEYGIVGLNDGLPSTVQAPFGGFKESGLGREGSHFGIEDFLEIKYISLGL